MTALLAEGEQVIVGDCREVLRGMEPDTVDLFCTSPPYAQGLEYEQGLDWEGLRDLMRGVAPAALAACKPSGFCFVNFGETTKYERTMAELYNRVFREAGWLMHSRRVWAKTFSSCAVTGAMQFNSIPTGEWEYLWTFRKPPSCREAVRDKTLSFHGIWTTTGQMTVGKHEHPAAFPVDIPEKAIRVWTDPGDLVCDPFCGSGSTGVAARRLGRRFVGIEQRDDYAALARRVIRQAQPGLFAEPCAGAENVPLGMDET